MILEIRSYRLKSGRRARFHELFVNEARPMLERWEVDVISHGGSLHDEASYYLMRAYSDLAERQRSQDAFYGSDEWRTGPRAAILDCIEDYFDVVIEVDDTKLQALRANMASLSC